MKAETYVFAIITATLFVSLAIIVSYASLSLNGMNDMSPQMGAELKTNAGKEVQSIAIAMRDSIDYQMQNQYTMVRTWAAAPVIVGTSEMARNYTKEQLFEMWSAQKTRTYGKQGMAQGDGNLENDLNPAASRYLAYLSKTTGTYPEIFFTDYRGYAIGANDVTTDFDQGPDDWMVFLENGTPVMRRNAPTPLGEKWYENANKAPTRLYVSDLKWDDSSATWGMEIVSQIRDPLTDEYEGQLKAVFNYGKFVHDAVNHADLNVNEIEIVSKDGVLVATSDNNQSAVNNESYFRNMEFFLDVQSGRQSGYTYEMDDHGEKVLIGYAVSEDVNKHIVIVTKKQSDVDAPINLFLMDIAARMTAFSQRLRSDLLFIAITTFVVALGIAFTLVNKKMRE